LGKTLIASIVLLLVCLLGFSAPGRAESLNVNVTAAEVYYDYEAKQVEASGNVLITYKNIKIESDGALIDQEQNILLATGAVRVEKDGNVVKGERFLYYLKTRQGWMSPIDAEITDEQIEGSSKLTGEEAFLKGEEIRAKKTFFTSCDRSEPHYHFSAAEVEYYPADRIILHKVWYWEGKIPLFYLPYLFISLKDNDNNFEVRAGYNDVVGWFLYVGYNYFLSDKSYGKVNLDLTERGGDGIGVKHYIENSKTSRWYQEFYVHDKQELGFPDNDYLYGFGYENSTDPTRQIRTTFENWHRFTELGDCYLDTKYFFNFAGQSPYPSLTFNFSETGEEELRILDLLGNWGYRFDPSLVMNLNGRWYYQEAINPLNNNFSFAYQLQASKNWDWSNLSLRVTDRKVYSGLNNSVNLLPDLIYTIPKFDSMVVGDLKMVSQYTHLEKFYTFENDSGGYDSNDSSGNRWALDLQKLPVIMWQQYPWKLDFQSRFRYRDFLIDDIVDIDSEIYAITNDIGLTCQFNGMFSTEVRLGETERDGEPNTYFTGDDNIQPGAFITNGWFWKSPQFNASLTTGYNFYTELADPVNLGMQWTPDSKANLTFRTVYDWYFGLGQTDLEFYYNPKEDWSLKLLLGYNFSTPDYPWTNKEFEAMIKQKLNDKWRIELASRFDFFANDFSVAELGVAYDWHCRELMVHYDWIQRVYWFQVLIKAFPDESRLRISSNMEDFYNELGFY
jgi:lipopolysaccharide export system protein LptA